MQQNTFDISLVGCPGGQDCSAHLEVVLQEQGVSFHRPVIVGSAHHRKFQSRHGSAVQKRIIELGNALPSSPGTASTANADPQALQGAGPAQTVPRCAGPGSTDGDAAQAGYNGRRQALGASCKRSAALQSKACRRSCADTAGCPCCRVGRGLQKSPKPARTLHGPAGLEGLHLFSSTML